MKACVVLAIFFVVAFVASAKGEKIDENYSPVHILQKRQLGITPRPNIPSCVSWECSSSCRRRGRPLGGYCNLLGCNCL